MNAEVPPIQEKNLTPAEKRAFQARNNAYRDVAAVLNKFLPQGLAVAPLPGSPSIPIFANVAAVAEMLGQLVMQVKQMEMSLDALADLVLAGQLATIRAVDGTQVIEPSIVTQQNYWSACAAKAERLASIMQRAALTAGNARPLGEIIRPS